MESINLETARNLMRQINELETDLERLTVCINKLDERQGFQTIRVPVADLSVRLQPGILKGLLEAVYNSVEYKLKDCIKEFNNLWREPDLFSYNEST